MPRESLFEHIVLPLDDRINLPMRFCKRLEWLVGEKVDAWLYLIEPGRYRLLSDQDVENDPQLEAIRARILHEGTPARSRPSQAKPIRAAADIARLVAITIDHHKGSWRLPWGEEFALFAPANCSPRNISVLMPQGHLEIWYTEVLRKALESPRKTD